MKTWQLVGVLSVAPILYAIALWVAFASAEITLTRQGWQFSAGPVAVVGIFGAILVIAATIVLLADNRPAALRGWQVWGSVVVLAMVAFVAVLLVMKGLEPYSWGISEPEERRFMRAGRRVIGIAVAALGIGYLLRRTRNGPVAVWLISGSLIAFVGLYRWMSWSHAIP